jgi:PKD repeat protein
MKPKALVVGCVLALLSLGGCTPKFQAVPPEAWFALRPGTGVAPLLVVLDGSLSFSESGKIEEYIWDFGDGTRGLGPIVSHTYRRGGTYQVVLEVYDERGLSSRRDALVEVLFPPPTASFSYTPPLLAGTGETIRFDASASTSPNGAIVAYHWAFGDGKWATGQIVEHTYWDGGAYPVTLSVVDEVGAVHSVTQTIAVQGGPGCGG